MPKEGGRFLQMALLDRAVYEEAHVERQAQSIGDESTQTD